MMSLKTFSEFMDGARNAYLHAVEKHPKYTTLVCDPRFTPDIARIAVGDWREANGKDGGDFNSILEEEIAEYIEASLLGDNEAAKRELMDCAAVIMREWERITQ